MPDLSSSPSSSAQGVVDDTVTWLRNGARPQAGAHEGSICYECNGFGDEDKVTFVKQQLEQIFDLSKLTQIIQGVGDTLKKIPGTTCTIKKPAFQGGIRIHATKECCEKEQIIVDKKEFSGVAKAEMIVSCGLNVDVPLVEIALTLDGGLKGEAIFSTNTSGCADSKGCGTDITVALKPTFALKGKLELVDESVLNVVPSGGIEGSLFAKFNDCRSTGGGCANLFWQLEVQLAGFNKKIYKGVTPSMCY